MLQCLQWNMSSRAVGSFERTRELRRISAEIRYSGMPCFQCIQVTLHSSLVCKLNQTQKQKSIKRRWLSHGSYLLRFTMPSLSAPPPMLKVREPHLSKTTAAKLGSAKRTSPAHTSLVVLRPRPFPGTSNTSTLSMLSWLWCVRKRLDDTFVVHYCRLTPSHTL